MAGERRSVHVFEDKTEVALQPFAAEPGFDVRKVELHFGVGGATVALELVGVVQGFAADDSPQDRVRRVVAGSDDDRADAELDAFEGEVDLVETFGGERFCQRFITNDRGLYTADRVARLERVDAVLVGGDARGRTGENNADELQRLGRGRAHGYFAPQGRGTATAPLRAAQGAGMLGWRSPFYKNMKKARYLSK